MTVEAFGFTAGLFPAAREFVMPVPEGTTVEGLVRVLADRYPAFASVLMDQREWCGTVPRGAIQVVIGGQVVDLAGGWERVLVDDDRVLLLPPFEGG